MVTYVTKTCGRCLGSGRYSRGTCFTCNGAGKVRLVKTKLADVEERLARVVWPFGAGGWMSPSMAEATSARNPGTTIEYTTRTVRKRVPV
jgi:hypothetical protein